LNPTPYILNLPLKPIKVTVNPNPKPYISNGNPQTPNPKLTTPNPKLQTLNPELQIPTHDP